jgi:dTDP-4-amino-4,6-dideoxygalactose transaminase
MNWKYPLFDTRFGPAERKAVSEVVRRGWLTMGPVTEQVEASLRERTGSPYAHLVTNGTAALEMAGAALGIGPGDEVLCPTLTFVAGANAFRTAGAKVVFVDSIGEDDLNLDPADVARKLTKRTKAIVVVHYAGFPARMEELVRLARQARVSLIEDCAHALFTRYRGQTLGTFGAAGCFSFFSNKNATCGEGGALLTRNRKMAEKVRLLRSHGMTTLTLERHRGHAFSYDVRLAGHNNRIDDLRAALLQVQLGRLDGHLARRRKLFRRYCERLPALGLTVPFASWAEDPAVEDVGIHLTVALLPKGTDRARVMEGLRDRGVQTSIHYPPVHRFTAYREGHRRGELRRTEDLCRRLISLPFYPGLTDAGVDEIVAALADVLKRARS